VKDLIKKYLLLSVLILLPIASWSQGQIYTKKSKLEDFPTRTTRVVLSGNEIMDAFVKGEVASRWRIAPFEFCYVSEYNSEKESSLYYFLRLTKDEDFTWLTVSKGGKPDDANPLKSGFDVISIPIASAEFQAGGDLPFLPAYLDILQEYLSRAQESEKVAYRGLKGICTKASGKLYFDAEEGLKAFLASEEGSNVIIEIKSAIASHKGYEMIISTDTHELHSIKRK